jgi:acetylglutamate kinase
MIDDELKCAFAQDIVSSCASAVVKPVVVHGGGPQISSMLKRSISARNFRGGLRVTTPEAMDVVRMVLVGQVGRELVNLINRYAPFAVGLSGEDAGLFTAEPKTIQLDGEDIDLGQVGDVATVNPDAVIDLIDAGRVPVVATVGPGRETWSTTSTRTRRLRRVATALGADRLVMLTDVAGLYATARFAVASSRRSTPPNCVS